MSFTLPRLSVICKNCADLDLKAAFEGEALTQEGYVASKRSPRQRWIWTKSRPPCDFCRFWLRCKELQANLNYHTDMYCIRDIRGTGYARQYQHPEPVFELVQYDDHLQGYVMRGHKVLIGHAAAKAEAIESRNSFRLILPKLNECDLIKKKAGPMSGKAPRLLSFLAAERKAYAAVTIASPRLQITTGDLFR